jgi:hypothetical protein
MYEFALGLPTTALLPDGDVLVVFYAGPSGDETDIHLQRLIGGGDRFCPTAWSSTLDIPVQITLVRCYTRRFTLSPQLELP